MSWRVSDESCGDYDIGRPAVRAAIDKARAERGKWDSNDVSAAALGLGPQWRGTDRHRNPLWKFRIRAVLIGAWLVLIPLLLMWGFAAGPPGMIPKSLVELFVIIGLVPGAALLIFGFGVSRYFKGLIWSLTLDRDTMTYGARHNLWPLMGEDQNWTVALDDVSSVEVGAAAEWESAQRGLLRDRPAPREEMQAFLFMADGSRRVIATDHEGRESMATLAQSVRNALLQHREKHRARGDPADRGQSPAASATSEGFTL